MNNDEINDYIRREVALNVVNILNALVNRNKKQLRAYQHFLPTYEAVCSESCMRRYFCPESLAKKGKRRVYVNSNNTAILYFSQKQARKLAANIITEDTKGLRAQLFVNRSEEKFIKSIIAAFADKWIISRSESNLTKPSRFLENVMLVEKDSSKNNHPPTGPMKFVPVDELIETEYCNYVRSVFQRNAMAGVYLKPVDFIG